MTDHKFTDDEIIKALECCSSYDCDGCPLYSPTINCVILLPQKALELVERQRAEIEGLESLCEKIGIANDAKFERICVLQEDLETAKSEAIKEFAERLCEGRVSNDPVVIAAKCLLKEIQYLNQRMAEIFKKDGFPQKFVDDLLGEVDVEVK